MRRQGAVQPPPSPCPPPGSCSRLASPSKHTPPASGREHTSPRAHLPSRCREPPANSFAGWATSCPSLRNHSQRLESPELPQGGPCQQVIPVQCIDAFDVAKEGADLFGLQQPWCVDNLQEVVLCGARQSQPAWLSPGPLSAAPALALLCPLHLQERHPPCPQ